LLTVGVDASFGGDVGVIYPVSLPSLTVGLPTMLPDDVDETTPEGIAITPDQAPVAHLTVTSVGRAGQPSTFDAGASTVAYGSVAKFVWVFGDGSPPLTTTSSDSAHDYARPGRYTVTLTETDSAQTSLPPAVSGTAFAVDGPGQTPFRRSSPTAQTTIDIDVVSSQTPGSPTLDLNPAVGAPGTVVTVTGTAFRPGERVTVAWSVPTGSSFSATADSQGDLPAGQLYILTPDVLGPRFAEATDAAAGKVLAKASFLVVPSTAEPGSDSGSPFFRSEGP
jgi:PKD repeat protein